MKAGFTKRMHQKRKIWIISILVIFVPAFFLLYYANQSILSTLPNPNGYKDFILAIEAAPSPLEGDYSKKEHAQLLVRSHPRVFEHVRAGLAKSCRVTERGAKRLPSGRLVFESEVAKLKVVQHLLLVRAKVLQWDGKMDEAYQAYEEAYRFAHESGRGGNAFDFVVEISRKALVMRQFKSVIPKLNVGQCKQWLNLIDRIENDPENTLDIVLYRNRKWSDHTYGFKWRFTKWKQILIEIVQTKSLSPITAFKTNLRSKTILYQSAYVEPVRAALLDKISSAAEIS